MFEKVANPFGHLVWPLTTSERRPLMDTVRWSSWPATGSTAANGRTARSMVSGLIECLLTNELSSLIPFFVDRLCLKATGARYWVRNSFTKANSRMTNGKYLKKLVYYVLQAMLMSERHGHGVLLLRLPNGDLKRIYVGHWENNQRYNHGRQYYPEGIYNGEWQRGARSGLGMMWMYKDKSSYMGEWLHDKYHGAGILFEGKSLC